MSTYIKITFVGFNSYTIPVKGLEMLVDDLKESSPGDEWKISVIEMTDEEYKALPDFTGF